MYKLNATGGKEMTQLCLLEIPQNTKRGTQECHLKANSDDFWRGTPSQMVLKAALGFRSSRDELPYYSLSKGSSTVWPKHGIKRDQNPDWCNQQPFAQRFTYHFLTLFGSGKVFFCNSDHTVPLKEAQAMGSFLWNVFPYESSQSSNACYM